MLRCRPAPQGDQGIHRPGHLRGPRSTTAITGSSSPRHPHGHPWSIAAVTPDFRSARERGAAVSTARLRTASQPGGHRLITLWAAHPRPRGYSPPQGAHSLPLSSFRVQLSYFLPPFPGSKTDHPKYFHLSSQKGLTPSRIPDFIHPPVPHTSKNSHQTTHEYEKA